jgi:hypothetical protein
MEITMKRFTGKIESGTYEVILIDNSVAMTYMKADFSSGWTSQKTEFRIPVPNFFSIEDRLFSDAGPSLDEDGNDEVASCRVTEDEDGDPGLTVTITNSHTREFVEWTFAPERSYGPLFGNGWNDVLHDIVDGMETEQA